MKKIAIIGAGFTGLTAAYRLTQHGYEVTIFEASEYIGGLASGFKIEGADIEKTYHHIFKTDTDIIKLVDELNLNDDLRWFQSSVSIYYNNKFHPFNGASDLIKFSPISFIDRIRAGLTVFYLQNVKSWKPFINVAAKDWVKKYMGTGTFNVIWKPLLVGKFSKYWEKISMSWLWARIKVRADSRDSLLAKERLGYFVRGFVAITNKLVEKINEKGGVIKTKAKITKLIQKENSVEVYTENEQFTFDALIATVPSHIFAFLVKENNLDPKYIEQLNSIDYLGAVCMVFSSEQDLGKYYWNNINDLEAPFLVLINHTKLIPNSIYNHKNVYYIGSYIPNDHEYFTQEESEIYAKWFNYLKKVYPEFDEGQIREKYMFRLKNAQHIVDLGYDQKIPDKSTPMKNIFLSNFSQIFPEDRGTNYAVREGNSIADLVIQRLNEI